MSTGTEEFLKAGIQHYGEAYITVYAFRDQMVGRLSDLLEGNVDRKGFRRVDSEDAISVKAGKKAGYGRWIYGLVKGTLGERQVSVDTGLWWGCPDVADAQAIFYAKFEEGPAELLSAPIRPKDPRVKVTKTSGKTLLYVAVTDRAPEINETFDLLLTELIGSVGAK